MRREMLHEGETGEMKMKGRETDPAHIWHLLDWALPALCQVRDRLEKAGQEQDSEYLAELIDGMVIQRDEAEREVKEDIDERPERSS